MLKGFFLFLVISVSGIAWAKPIDWNAEKWSFVSKEDTIKVYKKDFPNNPVTGVGGEGVIDAPIGKIVWVLLDNKNKIDWVDKFMDARTLATPSATESIQYGAFKMPAIISNRDFVYKYNFRKDNDTLLVDVVSVTHPDADPKKSVGVRGHIEMGQYTLKPVQGGKKTFVQVKYLTDPKGLIPKWLVNIVQKTWPLKTLQGLRKQVKKSFVKEHPMLKNKFQALVGH